MSANIKRTMLRLARKIANKEYQDKKEIHRGLDGSICGESYYPATYFKNLDIEKVLGEHEEFDEHEFRKMIKDFEIRLHDGEKEEE